jgi:L-ascorbate peroxidase
MFEKGNPVRWKELIGVFLSSVRTYFGSFMQLLRDHSLATSIILLAVLKFRNTLRGLFSRKQTRAEARQRLLACKARVHAMLQLTNSYPLMLRLAWSDSATFDKNVRMWPQCGGAIGSVRFESEYKHSNNAGLLKAISLLEPIQADHPDVSWADIIQMAGALAVELTGGPVIPNMRYGRKDAENFHEERGAFCCPVRECVPAASALEGGVKKNTRRTEGIERRTHMHEHDADTPAQLASRLPQALPPYPDGATIPGVHIRNSFYRMGFNNKEIVALCGAHTIGRAYSDRSKTTTFSSGPLGATKYTRPTSCPWGIGDSANSMPRGIGMPGGCSWTRNWLQFDNSYFRGMGAAADGEDLSRQAPGRYEDRNPVSQNWIEHGHDPELLWLPTDNALQTDPEFRTHFQRYSEDQEAFFRDYALAHRKMSELGARFGDEHGPIALD